MKKTLLILLLCFCTLLTVGCNKEAADDTLPEGCLRAENDATDFNFCYPNTWVIDRNDGMISIKTNVGKGGTLAYASISVQAYTMEDSTMSAGNFWDTHKADLEDLYGDKLSIEVEKEETKLADNVAARAKYSIKLSDMTYDFEQIICVRYGVAYMITLTAPEGTYETAAPGLETVMTYFVFE